MKNSPYICKIEMREKKLKISLNFLEKKSIKISDKNLVVKNNHRIFVK
jgi:hypothetical protein